MDLDFTPEQAMLRDQLARYLAQDYPFETRRARVRSGAGHDPALWRALGETLGVLGATLPERAGGLGGGAVETMIVGEALGAALVAEPWLEVAVIAGGVLARAEGARAEALLAGIAAGETRVVPAFFEAQSRYDARRIATRARPDGDGWRIDGAKAVVVGAPHADWLLVTAVAEDGPAVFLVAGDAPDRRDFRLIDERPASDLAFDDTAAERVDVPLDAIAAALDEGLAALCAEGVGVMRRMLADTVAYTRDRRQFGQPLSSFQVLQHRMVDMMMQVEQAAAATLLATLSLPLGGVTQARALAAAKVTVGDAIRFVGQNAVQLHGGMGMTEELAVGHYFKRATVIEQQFGPPDHHVARYARMMEEAA